MNPGRPLVLPLAPGRAIAALDRVILAVAFCALVLAPLAWEWRGGALVLLLGAWRKHRDQRHNRRLVLHPDGHVVVERAGASPSVGLCLAGSWIGSRWVLVRVRAVAGAGTLAISRERLHATDWRRLRAWLRFPPWQAAQSGP